MKQLRPPAPWWPESAEVAENGSVMKISTGAASGSHVKNTSPRRWARRGQHQRQGPRLRIATNDRPVERSTKIDGECRPIASSRTVCTNPVAHNRSTCSWPDGAREGQDSSELSDIRFRPKVLGWSATRSVLHLLGCPPDQADVHDPQSLVSSALLLVSIRLPLRLTSLSVPTTLLRRAPGNQESSMKDTPVGRLGPFPLKGPDPRHVQ